MVTRVLGVTLASWFVYLSLLYHVVLSRKPQQKPERLSEWGNPRSLNDLTTLFLNHLHSKVNTTPFSPGPLSAESQLILPHLEKLTKRSWWTVGSQPAVDGKDSSDRVFGWGPKTGYVFQKGFVEFFCTEDDLNQIAEKVEQRGEGWVHWFAANSKVCPSFSHADVRC